VFVVRGDRWHHAPPTSLVEGRRKEHPISIESPVILVHGAWQTAATWDRVVPQLRTAGCRVFAVELTGLEGELSPLTPDITLDTHIEDVVRVMESEDLRDATLVGHSYAGMIITGVAERAHERIARLTYVDAFVPAHTQSAMQLLPDTIQAMFRELARAEGDGWRLNGSERQLDLWGVNDPAAREFVRSRLCDFSIRCFEQPVSCPSDRAASIDRSYIACVAQDYPSRRVFERFAEKAKHEHWRYHELPTGHACHVEMPDAFSKLLMTPISPSIERRSPTNVPRRR
jgi:pimeloyl-ACP methyl ester carboxylesterase